MMASVMRTKKFPKSEKVVHKSLKRHGRAGAQTGIGGAKAGAKGDLQGRRAKGTPPLEMPTVSSETQNNKVQERTQTSSFPLWWGP